jgi:uncharacterized protein (TIGR03118 family)
MTSHARRGHDSILMAFVCVAAVALAAPAAAQKNNAYVQHNLVSDTADIPADLHDTHLINSWGITASSTSPWWIANADSGFSTVYNVSGPLPTLALLVTVSGEPTGTVFNGGSGFQLVSGVASSAARFLFASEDGTISGWNPTVDVAQAMVVFTSPNPGASYKGLAIARNTARGDVLYAADFHDAHVDIIAADLHLIDAPGAFVDPDLPAGYAPFGIQNINDRIFVAYAKQDEDAEEEVAGEGLGYVDVFDTAGGLIRRVASQGALNAPWGMALAPAGFGRFSGNLLVGNFGDGRINAFDGQTFEPRGHLKRPDQKPLVIDGLWGIGFGNGAGAGPATTLFFAAGPDEETHGLFGRLDAAPGEPGKRGGHAN